MRARRETMRATDEARERESHLSAFLLRHCAPVYIERDRERKRERERERERERVCFIAVLAYCRGSVDVLFRLFLPSLLHATHSYTTLHRLCTRAHMHTRAAARLSVRAANFARFHGTVSHDSVVVNFQLTNDDRSVSKYRREFTPFSPPPLRRPDIADEITAKE